jgi:hypothetical protein
MVRSAERAHRREDERREFEIRTLLDSRDALKRVARCSARYYMRDSCSYQGKPPPQQLPNEPDLGTESMDANAALSFAWHLILSDDLRAMVDRAQSLLNSIALCESEDMLRSAWSEAGRAVGNAMDALAARVRDLYSEDVITA